MKCLTAGQWEKWNRFSLDNKALIESLTWEQVSAFCRDGTSPLGVTMPRRPCPKLDENGIRECVNATRVSPRNMPK